MSTALLHLFLPEKAVASSASESSIISSVQSLWGQVNPHIYSQRISSPTFHDPAFQDVLNEIFLESGDTVGIVGVAKGSDVMHFAKRGFAVTAVEPLHYYVNALHTKMAAQLNSTQRARVNLIEAGAGPSRSESVIHFYNHTSIARIDKLDRLLSSPPQLLILDTQGSECSILSGSRRLLQSMRMLWVELAAASDCTCEQNNNTVPTCTSNRRLALLNLLATNHVLFDFTWWAPDMSDTTFATRLTNGAHFQRSDFYFGPRPNEITAYARDMCCVKQSNGKSYVQTDILAVHKDHLTLEHVAKLGNIGNAFCDELPSRANHRLCALWQVATFRKHHGNRPDSSDMLEGKR